MCSKILKHNEYKRILGQKSDFFLGFDKINVPKAPELSRISRWRFKNLAGTPETPEVEGPRVTYDSSEAVPAF